MATDTARITITGPGVSLDTVVPLKDAEAIAVLCLTYEPPLPSFAPDILLPAALELHTTTKDRDRVLVVLEWLRLQGFPNATAANVNAALRDAGAPEIYYAYQALARCADMGWCTRVGSGIYEIAVPGQRRLQSMRDARSATVRDHVR